MVYCLTFNYVSNIFRFYFVLIYCSKFSLFTKPMLNHGLKCSLLNVFYIYLTKRKRYFFIWACLFLGRRNYRSDHFLLMSRLRTLAWYLTCSSALYISPTVRLGVLEIWVVLVARLWPRACVLSTNMSIIFRI